MLRPCLRFTMIIDGHLVWNIHEEILKAMIQTNGGPSYQLFQVGGSKVEIIFDPVEALPIAEDEGGDL